MKKLCYPRDKITAGMTISLVAKVLDEGDPVDPLTVVLRVKDPKGREFTPNVIREEVGRFSSEFPTVDVDGVRLPGQWFYAWESTTPHGTDSGSVLVGKPLL